MSKTACKVIFAAVCCAAICLSIAITGCSKTPVPKHGSPDEDVIGLWQVTSMSSTNEGEAADLLAEGKEVSLSFTDTHKLLILADGKPVGDILGWEADDEGIKLTSPSGSEVTSKMASGNTVTFEANGASITAEKIE